LPSLQFGLQMDSDSDMDSDSIDNWLIRIKCKIIYL
jgi:hypothetical protein